MHGKIANIHQENRVELASLADLVDVNLPIIYCPNKYMQFIVSLVGLMVSLLCGLFGLLSIPIFMAKTPDGYGYMIGVVMVVCGGIMMYEFLKKLLSIRYPYAFAIYDDGVAFVGNAFKSKLAFIGFDRAYLAEFVFDRNSSSIYLHYVIFSDDGTEYRTHRKRMAHFFNHQKHDGAYWVQLINALIIQYQQTYQIQNVPKVKFIAQR